jgi:hypothetical protein
MRFLVPFLTPKAQPFRALAQGPVASVPAQALGPVASVPAQALGPVASVPAQALGR